MKEYEIILYYMNIVILYEYSNIINSNTIY